MESDIITPGKAWNNEAYFKTFNEASAYRNNLSNQWKDNEKHEGMQVKIKRLSERYVVKTRLHPDFDVKPTKEGKKNGKNRKRNKKDTGGGKFDSSASI